MTASRDELEDRIELLLEAALHRIVQWSETYPLDVFTEPDWKRAHEVLQATGMSVDTISAAAMRLAVIGAGKIALEALGETPLR